MSESRLTIIPIKSKRIFGTFDLGKTVLDAIKADRERLKNHDIVVVSSKFAAMAEGRFFKLKDISPSLAAKSLASRYSLDPHLAELILEESEAILGGIPGFSLAVSKGILAPNGGIDRSNVPKGYAILYPKDPGTSATRLRKYLQENAARKDIRLKIGTILSDSRVTPTRLGTIGIAIAASGFKPVLDFRGKSDLFGNKLKVTLKAVADQLSSAAQLVMGEAEESIPIVIIRGYHGDFSENDSLGMTISHDKCLYIQGLKNPFESGS